MSEPFSHRFQVAWGDLDANRHMRNTRYLDYAAQCRFLFFASQNFTPQQFEAYGIGPVVLTETMTYRKELHFLEVFDVRLFLAGFNEKGSKFIFVNRFVGADERPHGELRTTFVWFDLATRKSMRAPDNLMTIMKSLPSTNDFQMID